MITYSFEKPCIPNCMSNLRPLAVQHNNYVKNLNGSLRNFRAASKDKDRKFRPVNLCLIAFPPPL